MIAVPILARLAALVSTKGLQSYLGNRGQQEQSRRAASAALRQQLGGGQMPVPAGQGRGPWGELINDPQVEALIRDELFTKIFGKLLSGASGGGSGGASGAS